MPAPITKAISTGVMPMNSDSVHPHQARAGRGPAHRCPAAGLRCRWAARRWRQAARHRAAIHGARQGGHDHQQQQQTAARPWPPCNRRCSTSPIAARARRGSGWTCRLPLKRKAGHVTTFEAQARAMRVEQGLHHVDHEVQQHEEHGQHQDEPCSGRSAGRWPGSAGSRPGQENTVSIRMEPPSSPAAGPSRPAAGAAFFSTWRKMPTCVRPLA
jgi:hypothetical protein